MRDLGASRLELRSSLRLVGTLCAAGHAPSTLDSQADPLHRRPVSHRRGCVSSIGRAAVVVPCHNEEARLSPETYASFLRTTAHVHLVFVDDGSTDGTRSVLLAMQEREPERISVYDLPRNVGKGEAIRAGFARAFELDVDYCGYWDADLATPLGVIVDFCRLLDEQPKIEMVFGTRVRLLGRQILRRERRHYLGRVSATIISLALGLRVYDTQCGAKLFRISPQIRALFDAPFTAGWVFDVEIIARLIQARRGSTLPAAEDVIFEHPLLEWRDIEGSNVRASDYARAAIDLWRIYRRYLRE